MECLIPRIYDESGHFLYEAVQTSSGYMSHKRGVLSSHVDVQQVHLQWNEIEQRPPVSPQ